MKKEEILALFPREIEVTQEMIDKGRKNLMDSMECTGAQILKSLIPSHKDIFWGVVAGIIGSGKENVYLIANKDVMRIKEPTTISLKAVSQNAMNEYELKFAFGRESALNLFQDIESLKSINTMQKLLTKLFRWFVYIDPEKYHRQYMKELKKQLQQCKNL